MRTEEIGDLAYYFSKGLTFELIGKKDNFSGNLTEIKFLKLPQIHQNLKSEFASTAKTQLPQRDNRLYLWP